MEETPLEKVTRLTALFQQRRDYETIKELYDLIQDMQEKKLLTRPYPPIFLDPAYVKFIDFIVPARAMMAAGNADRKIEAVNKLIKEIEAAIADVIQPVNQYVIIWVDAFFSIEKGPLCNEAANGSSKAITNLSARCLVLKGTLARAKAEMRLLVPVPETTAPPTAAPAPPTAAPAPSTAAPAPPPGEKPLTSAEQDAVAKSVVESIEAIERIRGKPLRPTPAPQTVTPKMAATPTTTTSAPPAPPAPRALDEQGRRKPDYWYTRNGQRTPGFNGEEEEKEADGPPNFKHEIKKALDAVAPQPPPAPKAAPQAAPPPVEGGWVSNLFKRARTFFESQNPWYDLSIRQVRMLEELAELWRQYYFDRYREGTKGQPHVTVAAFRSSANEKLLTIRELENAFRETLFKADSDEVQAVEEANGAIDKKQTDETYKSKSDAERDAINARAEAARDQLRQRAEAFRAKQQEFDRAKMEQKESLLRYMDFHGKAAAHITAEQEYKTQEQIPQDRQEVRMIYIRLKGWDQAPHQPRETSAYFKKPDSLEKARSKLSGFEEFES